MSDQNVHRVHEDREGILDEGFEPRSSCAEVFHRRCLGDQVRLGMVQQHSPEQMAAHQPVSHESIYGCTYADKRAGGALWRELRCQK